MRLDMVVLPQASGKFCVVKIFNFQEKTKVECARKLCHGKTYMVDWKRDNRAGKEALHYMFEQMGGFQCLHHTLRTEEVRLPYLPLASSLSGKKLAEPLPGWCPCSGT